MPLDLIKNDQKVKESDKQPEGSLLGVKRAKKRSETLWKIEQKKKRKRREKLNVRPNSLLQPAKTKRRKKNKRITIAEKTTGLE